MFQKTGAKFKVEEFVEITLAGQDPFEAVVFLSVGDRLIDLLNDQRLFIPVKRMDNSTVIMAKSNIVSIVEKDPFAKPVDLNENDVPLGKDVAAAFDEGFEEEPGEGADTDNGHEDDDLPPKTDGSDTKGSDAGSADRHTDGSDAEKKRRRRRRKKTPEFDASAILKVPPDANLEEIRAAYKSRIKAVHPDSVAALDLDEELIRAAIHTTQRVNYAYHHILKERRNRGEEEPDRAA